MSDEVMESEAPTRESRRRALAQAVSQAVARGGRVESQSGDQAVIVYRRVSPGRLILCLLFWWPGFFFGHHRGERRELLTVDEFANALVQKV